MSEQIQLGHSEGCKPRLQALNIYTCEEERVYQTHHHSCCHKIWFIGRKVSDVENKRKEKKGF
jgi:hypothetical protein